MTMDENNIATLAELPRISTIPENKIKNCNIVTLYGILLQADHFKPPPSPAMITFTDLTAYTDDTLKPRSQVYMNDFSGKLADSAVICVILNQAQKAKVINYLKEKYAIEYDYVNTTDTRTGEPVLLHRFGILLKVQFYMKNYRHYLEGLCISVDFIEDINKEDPKLMQLLKRIEDQDIEFENKESVLTKQPLAPNQPPQTKKKRPIAENILFPQSAAAKRAKDGRFDTQQILLNANMNSDDEDEDEDDGFNYSDGQLGNDDEEDEIEEEEEESLMEPTQAPEQLEDQSFISVVKTIDELRQSNLDNDNSSTIRLCGYLLDYERGEDNEVIFVEKPNLTALNEENCIIMRYGVDTTKLVYGKKQEINVKRVSNSMGLIDYIIV